MHPLLLFFPQIHSYGAMLVLAWGIGWWVARRRARGFGIPSWHIDWLVPILLVCTALGTRLAGKLCQILSDGNANDRVLFGGLIMATGAGAAYAAVARIPLGRLGDAFAFSLPLTIATLRIGCFCAGCCWGDICVSPERLAVVDDQAWRRQVQTVPQLSKMDWPLRVSFPAGSPAYHQHLTAGLLPQSADRSLPVHPVQLYELAASLALFGVLVLVDRRVRRWGESFLLFGVGYCAIRFAVEWFRADNQLLAYDMTFSQWAGVMCACVCALVWSMRVVLAKRSPDSYNRPSAGVHTNSVTPGMATSSGGGAASQV